MSIRVIFSAAFLAASVVTMAQAETAPKTETGRRVSVTLVADRPVDAVLAGAAPQREAAQAEIARPTTAPERKVRVIVPSPYTR